MSTSITISLSGVKDAVQPVVDALDSIVQSSIVPFQNQALVTKTLTQTPGSAPTQVVYAFDAAIPNDQIWNFYRRVALEKGILGTKLTETTPSGIPAALSFVGGGVAANGQGV